MGRWYWDSKNTVEDCRSVSISFLRKHDYFCGFRTGAITWTNRWGEETASIGVAVSTVHGENYVRFIYTSTDRRTDEKTRCDYKVYLTTTPCHFGGVRYWFICPLITNGSCCGRRVGTLYCPPGATYYGCRHCYNLSYESRNESRLGRPGGIGHSLILSRKMEELHPTIKRWWYRGQPTRKARKYYKLLRQAEGQPPVEVLMQQLYRGR